MKAQSIEASVLILHDLTARLMKKIEERAADPAMQNIPGGRTGLIIRTQEIIGEGPNARTIVAYEVDENLLYGIRLALELDRRLDASSLNPRQLY
jgi:hypothetical protein